MEKKHKTIIKISVLVLFILYLTFVIKSITDMKRSEDFRKNNDVSIGILNNSDFILGLKSIPQLEYSVGDTTVNINEEDDFYKTFENNSKYEIFIDKKSEEINSLHYTSKVDSMNEEDKKYLKNIYNLTFSNMSSYMLEKTNNTIEHMCESSYISNNNSSIVKNGTISESIIIGKTSEIKITVSYYYNGSKYEPDIIDIAILKGNKW